jgi:hypothetical protein
MIRTRSWQLLAAVVGFTLLGVGAARGVTVAGSLLEPDTVQHLDNQDRELRCVRDELERTIPAGATVYAAPDRQLWDQRVVESTYPRFRVTSRRSGAAYVVRVEQASGPCGDIDLQVQRLR